MMRHAKLARFGWIPFIKYYGSRSRRCSLASNPGGRPLPPPRFTKCDTACMPCPPFAVHNKAEQGGPHRVQADSAAKQQTNGHGSGAERSAAGPTPKADATGMIWTPKGRAETTPSVLQLPCGVELATGPPASTGR